MRYRNLIFGPAKLVGLVWVVACADGATEPAPAPNRAPRPSGSIPALSVPVGETAPVNVSSYFSDPDGDPLSYVAESFDAAVATVAVTGSTVTVTGVAAGTATVAVTASDPGGLSTQQAFEVTVPNQPPQVTDSIPDQTLHAGDTVWVNLAQHFTDPDGDALSYQANTSDADVARASVSDSVLMVAAVGAGSANVTVTATDPGGLAALQELGVTVAESADVCGRTPQVRDGIVEATGAPGCRSVTAVMLGGIRNLILVDGGLTSLRQGDFEGLTGLRALVLANHELVSLPDGVFADLENLEYLTLSHNELASLQPNTFSDLSNLEELSIIDNPLMSLREGTFSGLDRLRQLDLGHNSLTSISASAFSGLSSLVLLHLGHNELTSLPESVFSGLTTLRLLRLNNNRLTSLPDGLFSGLDELSSLRLSSNQLESLPAHVFSGLHRLEHLWVEDNLLSSLPARVFSGLHRLENLSLGSNLMSSLPEGLFAEMSVRNLSLGGNRLTSLPEGVFSGLADLEILELSSNQLTSLPSGIFSGLTSLGVLFLGENQLDSLPEGIFSGLPGFELLWLDGNPGAPFEFGLQLERIDGPNGAASPDSVRLVLGEGTPFDLVVPLSVQSGTLSADSAFLSAGSTAGPALNVTQGATGQSTRVVATGAPPDLNPPGGFVPFKGFAIGWPGDLILFGSGMGWDESMFRKVALRAGIEYRIR